MFLIQLLLPLYDNAGAPLGPPVLSEVRRELLERFGGLTAYSRAPAQGAWRDGASVDEDDILVVEVMADTLDRAWWGGYRAELEQRLGQKELVVRCHAVEKL